MCHIIIYTCMHKRQTGRNTHKHIQDFSIGRGRFTLKVHRVHLTVWSSGLLHHEQSFFFTVKFEFAFDKLKSILICNKALNIWIQSIQMWACYKHSYSSNSCLGSLVFAFLVNSLCVWKDTSPHVLLWPFLHEPWLDETTSVHMWAMCLCVCKWEIEKREFVRVCVCAEGGKTLLSFVFVMITHGGIMPQAARWSLSLWGLHNQVSLCSSPFIHWLGMDTQHWKWLSVSPFWINKSHSLREILITWWLN